MAFLAGKALTALDLNAAILNARIASQTGLGLTITVAAQDAPGATITVTTLAANMKAFVVGIFDVNNTSTDVFTGALLVDGVTQPGQAISGGAGRNTVTQVWLVTLGTIGSHTLKLQGAKVGNVGVVTLNQIHTQIGALIAGI